MALNIPFPFAYRSGEPPKIPIAILSPSGRRRTVDVIVDSGADGTLLDIEVAEALDLDLRQGQRVAIGGVGGSADEARVIALDVEVLGRADLTIRIDIAFAPDVADTFGNLLGLNALRHLDFALQHSILTGYLGAAGGI